MRTIILLALLTLAPHAFAQTTDAVEQSFQFAKKNFLTLNDRAKAASIKDWGGACYRSGEASNLSSRSEMGILVYDFKLLENHEIFTRMKNEIGSFFMMRLTAISEANLPRCLQSACYQKDLEKLAKCGAQVTDILSQE